MKHALLSLMFSIIILTSSAQIQKSEIKEPILYGQVNKPGTVVSLKYDISGSDTVYILTFQNLKYQHITEFYTIKFNGNGSVVDSLYSVLSSAISLEKGKKMSFKLGEEDLLVTRVKVMGFNGINISVYRNGARATEGPQCIFYFLPQ